MTPWVDEYARTKSVVNSDLCRRVARIAELVLRPTHRDHEMTCRGSKYLIKEKAWSGGSGGKGSFQIAAERDGPLRAARSAPRAAAGGG
jgi:hypothetical protein